MNQSDRDPGGVEHPGRDDEADRIEKAALAFGELRTVSVPVK